MRSIGGALARIAGGRGKQRDQRKQVRLGAIRGSVNGRAWSLAAVLFLGATVTYGLAAGGHFSRSLDYLADQTASATARAGFAVRRVTIEGQKRTADKDILKALGVSEGTSALAFDTVAAKARLERLAWVREAQVMRLLPSTVRVVITEREPFAAWQIKRVLKVIDAEGQVIGPYVRRSHGKLPLVVGQGAAREAGPLFDVLKRHAELKAHMKAAIRVAERRWTLKLDNGVDVLLPEEGIARALDKLAELGAEHDILSGDVVAVDLRLADRVTVRLTDEAAARKGRARTSAKRDA